MKKVSGCEFFVDAEGNVYGKKATDQPIRYNLAFRTVKGKPVASVGWWSIPQQAYAPFRAAVQRATRRLALRS